MLNLKKELALSGIAENLGRLNAECLDGDETFNVLLPEKPLFPLHNNNGTLSSYAVKRYGHWRDGGIGYFGEDIITGKPHEQIFQVKLTNCKADRKYESKEGESARLFFPRVTTDLWAKIGEFYGVSIPARIEVIEGGAVGFWQWVLANPSIPIALDEGAKKAIAVTQSLLPCVGAGGHTMFHRSIDESGDGRSTKQLPHPELSAFLTPNRRVYVLLDRDSKPTVSRLVSQSRNTLAKLCYDSDAIPYFLSRATDYKGTDDFIVAVGADSFINLVSCLDPVSRSIFDRKPKKIPACKMADILYAEIDDRLMLDDLSSSWYFYQNGVYHTISQRWLVKWVEQQILYHVEAPTYNYINEVCKFLESRCLSNWHQKTNRQLLCFKNGVYSLPEKKLLPHDPKYRFTQQIARDYVPCKKSSEWPTIKAFLRQAANQDEAVFRLLIAICTAVLKSRSDLHKIFHLFGEGRNGKGVFIRLLTKLVGEHSTHETTLERLCENRFDSSQIQGKKLVTLSDQSQYGGSIDVLKKASGGDMITGEQKWKDAINFRFDGMMVLASNKSVFIGDNSYGVQSRLVLVPFNHTPAEKDRRDFGSDFDRELDAFTGYLLEIEDEWVDNIIRNAGSIDVVKQCSWELRTESDSLAAFGDENLVEDNEAIVPVKELYVRYKDYCRDSGRMPKAIQSFVRDLCSLAKSIGISVEREKKRIGVVIKGIRLTKMSENGGNFNPFRSCLKLT
jgi:putative DNA primase/helicase